jgi:LETM1 and EF-hand domain-containing protein 1
VVAAWLASVPGKLLGLSRMSRSEWRAMLSAAWSVVKKEAHHYWVGTKLLAAEVQISGRLLGSVLRGHALSRRERKQLTRTTADMFRLVPLLVILVVPFMELALPVLLKLFPNMLPSTFQDKLKHEEALRAQLRAKLELAKFLQDTTDEMAKQLSSNSSRSGDVQATAAELYDFMKRVRSGGKVANADIVRFAKLFNDEITLDSVDRTQLVNMCKFVNIPPYGTDTFLRYQLREALRAIKADDLEIAAEGVESLSYDELRTACRSRGMRWDGESVGSMRTQLGDWLELSLQAALPSSLLILSRAFTITHQRLEDPEKVAVQDLEATLASLPDEVLKQVELEACAPDDSAEHKLRRLESLRFEELMIAEEKADVQQQCAAEAQQQAAGRQLGLDEPSEAELSAAAMAERRAAARRLARALATLAGASPVASERGEFAALLEREMSRYKGMVQTHSVSRVLEDGAAGKLSERLTGLLNSLEKQLGKTESDIGRRLHRLDLNRDGRLERSELAGAAAGLLGGALASADLREILGPEVFDEEGRLSVDDLLKLAGLDDDDLLEDAQS